jgi:two-component system nitrate/nitrite response regulator NarL
MRIIFADDHFLIRATLRQFLAKLGDRQGTVLIDETDSLLGVLAHAGTMPKPDLILLDIHMPGMNGLAGISQTRTAFPDSPVVILSGQIEHETILASFRAGAQGFIPKTTERDEMLAALRLVLQGQRYVPPMFMEQELQGLNVIQSSVIEIKEPPTSNLSARELTILKQLADGKKNKEIAPGFGVEEVTIKLALRNLYKKINAANRAAAVGWAIKAGLV